MEVLLFLHQLSRRLDLDYRNLQSRIERLGIDPDVITPAGRCLYGMKAVEKIEADLLIDPPRRKRSLKYLHSLRMQDREPHADMVDHNPAGGSAAPAPLSK